VQIPRYIILSLLLLVASAGSALAQQVSGTDLLGRTVSLDQPAARIVSMAASHTDLVIALGAADRLVGVDEHSVLPEGVTVPNAGNAWAPSLEVIVGMEPDLVLVDQYSDLHELLTSLGVTVYAGFPEDMDDMLFVNAEVGELLGLSGAAQVLSLSAVRDVARARALTGGLDRVSVYAEADASLFAAGQGSWLGELIAAAGGVSIVPASAGTFPQLTAEFILMSDPDVIILLDAPWGESAETLLERPGWPGLSALESGRVIETTQAEADLLSRAGPGLGDALDLLLRWLHPELFAAD